MTVLLTAALAVGALAGCSEKTGGTANTTTPAGTETSSTAPSSDGADTGLSIAKFVSKPCDVLTSAQLSQLGALRPAEPGSGPLGEECSWEGQDVIKNSSYSVAVSQDRDVEEMVANVKSSPVFTDHEVEGVRFVTYDGTDGSMDCTTIIEASKSDSVTVIAQMSAEERAAKKPCTQVELVAKMIVENLRG